MARHTVKMPSETNIRSMELLPLQNLALECEIDPSGIVQQTLVTHLLTLRALFDGRQFSIPRENLVALAGLVDPSIDTAYATPPGAIALAVALKFKSLG